MVSHQSEVNGLPWTCWWCCLWCEQRVWPCVHQAPPLFAYRVERMFVGSVNPHCYCCKMTTGNCGSIAFTVYCCERMRTQMGDWHECVLLRVMTCRNELWKWFSHWPGPPAGFLSKCGKAYCRTTFFSCSVGCEAKLQPNKLVCETNLKERGRK